MLHRLTIGLLALLASCCLCAQGVAVGAVPVQAELLTVLDVKHTSAGEPVLLRVILPWKGPDCDLRAGSIVQGHVTSVQQRSKLVPDSELQVVFTLAECNRRPAEKREFELIALIAATGSLTQTDSAEVPPLANAPVSLSTPTGGSLNGFRTLSSAVGYYQDSISSVPRTPASVRPGQALGMRGVSLGVGTGAEGATAIRATRQELRLERGTYAILLPARVVTRAASASAPALKEREEPAEASVPTPPAAEPPLDTDVCNGTCHLAAQDVAVTSLSATLPLAQLGYIPREAVDRTAFADEAVLTWLDTDTLLCTFDLHSLRTRGSSGREPTRLVRAALIDPKTYRVKRVVDWRVHAAGPYLWRLAADRIAVESAGRLRILNAQLALIATLPLDGRLLWVVTSPSAAHLAVGTLHERHTPELHAMLEKALASQPEEDTLVRVYDAAFHVVHEAQRSSNAPMPAFSDDGELRTHFLKAGRWEILEDSWQHAERSVAKVSSTCQPRLSAPVPGDIFAVGCSMNSPGHWYRVLKQDGHVLLKGDSPSSEIEQSLAGSAQGNFALRIIRAHQPLAEESGFNRNLLTDQQIFIYDPHGVHLHTVTTGDFAMEKHSFSLAPGGATLALLGRGDIQFYRW